MRQMQRIAGAALSLLAFVALGFAAGSPWTIAGSGDTPRDKKGPAGQPSQDEAHRSPIALAVSADGTQLLVANQTADSVSLVDVKAAKVLDETKTGKKPAGVALSRDGRRGVVAHWYGYDVAILNVSCGQIAVDGRVEVGPEPRGVAITADGKMAFVAVGVTNEIVKVDVANRTVTGRLGVGREPRSLALTPDDGRLIVSNARSQNVTIVDAKAWRVVSTIPIDGDNLRQVAVTADGKTGYLANMRNRGFATTRNNIDLGWVLGQRLTRVPLDGTVSYATLSLDTQGKAASDAHGVAVSRDQRFVAVSCGGSHEVMIFRTDLRPIPWRPDSSRDLIAPELLKKDGRYRRVELGGRPTELAFAPEGSTLYVANYLADAIHVVDAETA